MYWYLPCGCSTINEGATVGVLSSFSGTVGATIAALNLMGEPVPATGISGNLLNKQEEQDSAASLKYAQAISDIRQCNELAVSFWVHCKAPILNEQH